ncbi:uncharacterized protein BDR25DRAFT_359147 [Lindgomyces ingoldianus]|uniref:Uncharacterized protein n=1 Tax=Lindgomyces ingoldianus TaxID=673940 RepID=A0ACB6QJI9_9PLEO|nr:uncharacterized protein BDR25DRAFT_359147 [Lindgomyces ingoldianus]KAF2467124.1 hypothetical protein BDR25DRAFT_359147 [Lindgomyces ingoldianus]
MEHNRFGSETNNPHPLYALLKFSNRSDRSKRPLSSQCMGKLKDTHSTHWLHRSKEQLEVCIGLKHWKGRQPDKGFCGPGKEQKRAGEPDISSDTLSPLRKPITCPFPPHSPLQFCLFARRFTYFSSNQVQREPRHLSGGFYNSLLTTSVLCMSIQQKNIPWNQVVVEPMDRSLISSLLPQAFLHGPLSSKYHVRRPGPSAAFMRNTDGKKMIGTKFRMMAVEIETEMEETREGAASSHGNDVFETATDPRTFLAILYLTLMAHHVELLIGVLCYTSWPRLGTLRDRSEIDTGME